MNEETFPEVVSYNSNEFQLKQERSGRISFKNRKSCIIAAIVLTLIVGVSIGISLNINKSDHSPNQK
jgi:hypothetical protein